MPEQSLQEKYAPNSTCYGCGPANPKGLHVKSFVQGEQVVAKWIPEKYHEAFVGFLSGGIIGTLLDCHSNWAAAWFMKKYLDLDYFPDSVTAKYSVTLKRPTPTNKGEIELVAKSFMPGKIRDYDSVEVESELKAGGNVCAVFNGTFIRIENPDHPAYGRWSGRK
ncbi:TPA: PaaI family thioesterase [archaeon]|uniref:PaaI family thioesterase n=1 Tax=Candidatus Naiadarchaeum limnaeum TaxID=2756139 RepID=A0A832V970_9ARCH|nr:PaaI family thioesterase [Candidatus Naiadarchaeales archaeon SRR2090153.bin1042]HIJ99910.1 PaaI family thioesterase [Candidatus Naiadarchaeum limnaeum]